LDSSQYRKHAENRKKQELIRNIQARWEELDKKKIKTISEEFSISVPTASRYISMTAEDIAELDKPTNYKKRKTVMDDYFNIIYKMLNDKVKPEIIISYVIKSRYSGKLTTLEDYIKVLTKNNFNKRLQRNWAFDYSFPYDITVIKRGELLRYITTKNPKITKSEVISQNFEIIKDKYPVVSVVKDAYDEFYDILMNKYPEKLDGFLDKYKDSVIQGFVQGIELDIKPVKNAISRDESSGFVEGSNNKFKLIKRILFGRASLPNLFKKAYLAFKLKANDFNLSRLTKKDASF
jgi:hypothetical protein